MGIRKPQKTRTSCPLKEDRGMLTNAAVIVFDTTDVAWLLCHQFTNYGIWQLNRKYSYHINAFQMLAVCIQSNHNKKCHSLNFFVPWSASITYRTILINTARYAWYITRCFVLLNAEGSNISNVEEETKTIRNTFRNLSLYIDASPEHGDYTKKTRTFYSHIKMNTILPHSAKWRVTLTT